MKTRKTQLVSRTRRTPKNTKPTNSIEVTLKPEPYLFHTVLVGVFLDEEEIGAFVCNRIDYNNAKTMEVMVKDILANFRKGGDLK